MSVIVKKLVDGNENVQCIASSATVNEELIGKLVQSGPSSKGNPLQKPNYDFSTPFSDP
jgi:hypothetical protein